MRTMVATLINVSNNKYTNSTYSNDILGNVVSYI
jgi:hypothetical protein